MSFDLVFDHPRDKGLDAIDHPVQVDTHDPIPVLVGHVRNVGATPHARVVTQNRYRAEPRFSLIGNASVGLAIPDIEDERSH